MPAGTKADHPRISVLIAAYNTRDYIAQAIDSVLQQKGVEVEIIVIDDASTDGTGTFIQERYRDPRVRLFSLPNNHGPSAARNIGLQQARGEWVAVLDSDDWFYPGRLKRLVEGAEEYGFDLVGDEQALYDHDARQHWALRLQRAGTLPKNTNGTWYTMCIEDVLGNMALGVLQLVVRREYLLRHEIAWNEEVRYGEDYLFLVDCMLTGMRLGVLNKPYYGVRIRRTSLTADRQASQRQLQAMLDRIVDKPEITHHSDWKRRIDEAQARIEENMRYSAIIDHAKGGGVVVMTTTLLCHPEIWSSLVRRIPGMVRYKCRRYFAR